MSLSVLVTGNLKFVCSTRSKWPFFTDVVPATSGFLAASRPK